MESVIELADGQSIRSETPSTNSNKIPIPSALQEEVDPTTWGKLTEFDNLDSPTPQQVSSHIGFLIECWHRRGITAQVLWCKFADEFEEWDKDRWAQVPPRMVKHLRAFLLTNGIFVDTDGARITANLERAAKRPSFRAWTMDEINTQISRNAEFGQNMKNPDFAANIQTASKPWQP
ncbi:MAG: hypothetical protein M1840_005204 [Geoglossum simile]|nr:MAG: hypothetical protein M1840_005204 [Geoglossum simile]